MVKCSRCGMEFDDNMEICPNCGNDLHINDKKDDSKKCDNCGSALEEDVSFCPTCGAKVVGFESKKEVKCLNCGAILEEGSDFCSQCGSGVNAIEKVSSKKSSEDIFFVKVVTFSLITAVAVAILSVVFLAIMNTSSDLYNIPYFPLAFYLALFLGVGFFAALQKNYMEAVLLSVIVGLLMAILEGFLVSLVLSTFGYGLVFGYHSVEFIVFSAVIGFVSNYLLKDYFSKHIKIDALF